MAISATGAAGGLRECCQPAARARRNAQSGNLHPHGFGCGAQPADSADAHREHSAGHAWEALAGLAVAYAGTRTILRWHFPTRHTLPIHASPSLPVLGFALLLSLVYRIVFGIVPAWITSHSDPAEALRGINRSTRDRASLPQKSLIVFRPRCRWCCW